MPGTGSDARTNRGAESVIPSTENQTQNAETNATENANTGDSVAQFSRVPGEPDAWQQKGPGTRESTSSTAGQGRKFHAWYPHRCLTCGHSKRAHTVGKRIVGCMWCGCGHPPGCRCGGCSAIEETP